jgi:hypothetical protein
MFQGLKMRRTGVTYFAWSSFGFVDLWLGVKGFSSSGVLSLLAPEMWNRSLHLLAPPSKLLASFKLYNI